MIEYILNDMRPLIGVAVLALLAIATLRLQLQSRRESELLEWAARPGRRSEPTSSRTVLRRHSH